MKRALLWIFALLILGALGYAALRLSDERRFAQTGFGEGTRTLVVPPGTGPRALARLLQDGKVVSDEARFYEHLHFFRRGKSARAGEYEFSGALTPDEVLNKLVRGEVKLYHFTVPEGLRTDEVAPLVGETGLCDADEFLKLARDPAVASKLGVPAQSLEGFLFPDTYSIPRGSGCLGIAQAMVARFQKAWQQAQPQRLPEVKLNELQAVTLASIIEKETARAEERPRVSCVFHNRLKKGIPLGTDPTVIYAILVTHDFKWDGNIHKADLSLRNPYNTYLVKGLPPGPIANPGQAAMEAALHPLICTDLFFVSRNDHTHVFCPDLKCHEENVRKFQIEYFRKKAKSG